MLCLMQVNLCRSIKTLIDFEPPATTDEVNASALQFVRKTADCATQFFVNVAGAATGVY